MTKQVQKTKEKEKKIEEVIKKVKEILRQLHLNTFYKYREAGQEIIKSGYDKGKWHSKHFKNALEEWGISQTTFSSMVQLGEMTEQEFTDVIGKFPSVYAWTHQPQERTEIVWTPLPRGKFRTIVIDPPWEMKKILRVERHLQKEKIDYATASFEDIKAFPLNDIADEDCHVYLWTTHKYLPNALEVFEAWGVKYQCLLTWIKNVGFTPFSWMYSTEHVLFGRIGNLELLQKGRRLDFEGKVRQHSRKPDSFYELVREVSPAPRIDVFSREKREGFEQYGNEVEKFNDI